MTKILTHFVLLLLLSACIPNEKEELKKELQHKKNELYLAEKKTAKERETPKSPKTKTLNWGKDPIQICREYFHQLDSLRGKSNQHFLDSIMIPALQNEQVSSINKEFLVLINQYLQLPWEEKIKIAAFENVLFAIIPDGELPPSIFSSEKIICSKDGRISCVASDFESVLSKTSKLVQVSNEEYFSDSIRYKLFPAIVDEVYDGKQLQVFGPEDYGTAEIVNFGVTLNHCDNYYFYLLEFGSQAIKSEPLIGSPHQIDLEYIEDTFLDSLLNPSSDLTRCYDCPVSSDRKVFAKMKGVQGLYFAYSSTHPTPSRSLLLKMDNFFIPLWSESLDLFGCSCL